MLTRIPDIMNQEDASQEDGYRSATVPASGAENIGNVMARKIKPPPVELQPNCWATKMGSAASNATSTTTVTSAP